MKKHFLVFIHLLLSIVCFSSFAFGATDPKTLAIGSKAPDFELSTKTADGPKKLRLSSNFGKKNTVLLFFPMAFTGVCTKEMCEVSQGLNSYAELNAA